MHSAEYCESEDDCVRIAMATQVRQHTTENSEGETGESARLRPALHDQIPSRPDFYHCVGHRLAGLPRGHPGLPGAARGRPGRPVRVLAAFTVVTAAPGEHAEGRLTVPARVFDRYDEAAGGWVRPSGEFTVRIGRSSADLPLHLRVKADDYRQGAGKPQPEPRGVTGAIARRRGGC